MNPEQPREIDPSQETSVEIDLAKVGEVALEKLRSLEIIIEKLEQEKQEIKDRTTQEGEEQNKKDVGRLEFINNALEEYKQERKTIKGLFDLASPQAETGS